MDKNKKLACFITGHINASEEERLEPLQGENKAQIIINKYKKEGLRFLKLLRGEFNIIIIDEKQAFLINDTLGLSPMYIRKIKDGIIFCNQAEPIVWLNKNNQIDYNSIADFLIYGFVPDGKTFIRDVWNQEPGTIVSLDNQKVSTKKYAVLKPMDLKGLGREDIFRLAKDTFGEALKIRAYNRRDVISELSGGWDTRFVLANLLELNKKVIVFTANRDQEDFKIAKLITKTLGLEHIILDKTSIPGNLEEKYFFKFECLKSIYDNDLDSGMFNKNLSELQKMKFFTSPHLTGIYGTELFGYIPKWFIDRTNLRFDVAAREIISRDLMSRITSETRLIKPVCTDGINGYIYRFLTQIGRSYFNSHYTGGWQRPTVFFSHLFLNSFSDSKFVAFLSGLKYRDHMNYKLYDKIFSRYYPDLLKIPWTSMPGRRQNNLKNKPCKKNERLEKRQKLKKLIEEDKAFRKFLKETRLIQKKEIIISARLKELYFLFKWFDINKPILHQADLDCFSRYL